VERADDRDRADDAGDEKGHRQEPVEEVTPKGGPQVRQT
jgi:hypothetical protein